MATHGNLWRPQRTCESKSFPLPKVTLVKEVPDVVHKPCDRRLFGGV